MEIKKLKERLKMIYGYLNRISVTGTENAENLTIAAKLLQDLYQSIPDERGDAE
ncbi:MAG: hypothetical protein ACI3W6_07485 [Clostridia bacterium]